MAFFCRLIFLLVFGFFAYPSRIVFKRRMPMSTFISGFHPGILARLVPEGQVTLNARNIGHDLWFKVS